MNKRMTYMYISSVFLFVINTFASANDFNALREISRFSQEICTSPSLKGNTNSIILTSDASAKTKGLIKKLVGLDVQGAVKYNNTKYNNVLQTELAKTIKSSNNCKLEVLRLLNWHFPQNNTTEGISTASNNGQGASTSSSNSSGACGAYAGPDGASSSCSSGKNGTSVSTFANEKKSTGSGASAN